MGDQRGGAHGDELDEGPRAGDEADSADASQAWRAYRGEAWRDRRQGQGEDDHFLRVGRPVDSIYGRLSCRIFEMIGTAHTGRPIQSRPHQPVSSSSWTLSSRTGIATEIF